MGTELVGEELYRFLSEGTKTANIACVKKDGTACVSPVTFIVDNDELVFTTLSNSLKARIIRRDPRIAISVDSHDFPYGFALLSGDAELFELEHDELLSWIQRIASRYVPPEKVEKVAADLASADEILVRVRIRKSRGYEGLIE